MSVRVVAVVELPSDPWADVDIDEIHAAVANGLAVQFGILDDLTVIVDPAGQVVL